MAAVNESESHCSGKSSDNVVNIFIVWPHAWVSVFLENENEGD